MKKLVFLLLIPVFSIAFTTRSSKELTASERKFAIDHLNKTRADLEAAVKGLSEAQLNYKSSPDRWSVLECVQHIMLSSESLGEMMHQTAATPNDSGWQSSITDDAFIKSVEDRSHKAQSAEPWKPSHAPSNNIATVLQAFSSGRDSLIRFTDTTHMDLRSHVANLGFAKVDAYQLILLISAHTNRHTQQINEVKADAGFPKK